MPRRLFGQILARIERLQTLVTPAPSQCYKMGHQSVHSINGWARGTSASKNTNANRAAKKRTPVENEGHRKPLPIGKPLNASEQVGTLTRKVAQGSYLGNVQLPGIFISGNFTNPWRLD